MKIPRDRANGFPAEPSRSPFGAWRPARVDGCAILRFASRNCNQKPRNRFRNFPKKRFDPKKTTFLYTYFMQETPFFAYLSHGLPIGGIEDTSIGRFPGP
jgi:hypothetical protein